MSIPTPSSRRLFGFALGVALPMVAASQTASIPTEADFEPGDRWVWRRVDGFTGIEQSRFSRTVSIDKDQVTLTVGGKPHSVTETFTRAPKGDDQSNPWRAWPLAVGKKWHQVVPWTNAYGKPAETRRDVEVAGFEQVTVPAGTFMAFRIESRGLWQTHDYVNFSGTGSVSDTYWYSPEAQADVKVVHKAPPYEMYTQELIVYQRKPR